MILSEDHQIIEIIFLGYDSARKTKVRVIYRDKQTKTLGRKSQMSFMMAITLFNSSWFFTPIKEGMPHLAHTYTINIFPQIENDIIRAL